MGAGWGGVGTGPWGEKEGKQRQVGEGEQVGEMNFHMSLSESSICVISKLLPIYRWHFLPQ